MYFFSLEVILWPAFHFSAAFFITLVASLAKSWSLTSEANTGVIENASLSVRTAAVPSCKDRKTMHTLLFTKETTHAHTQTCTHACMHAHTHTHARTHAHTHTHTHTHTHLMHNWLVFIIVNSNRSRMHPSVSTQMMNTYVWSSEQAK